jgi:hypothetical protein
MCGFNRTKWRQRPAQKPTRLPLPPPSELISIVGAASAAAPGTAQLCSQRETAALLMLRPRGGCTACSACRGVSGEIAPLLVLIPAPLAPLLLASPQASLLLPLATAPPPPLVL